MTTLAEDLVLLATGARRKTGPDTGTLSTRFYYGLRGAELVSLALAGRVEVTDGRIVLRDNSAPLDDPALNTLLTELTRQAPPLVKDWMAAAHHGLSNYYFDRLAAAGALEVVSYQLLLIVRVRGYKLVDVAGYQDARRRLDAAVLSQGPIDSAQSALAGLAYAAGLDDLCYPGSQGKAARDRMKEVATGVQGAAAAAAKQPGRGQSTWYPYPVDPNLLNPDLPQGANQSGGPAAAQAAAHAAHQAGQAAAGAGADAAVHAAAHAAVHASVTAAVSAATQTAHSHHSSGGSGSDSGSHHHSSGSSDSGGGHHH
jgi:Golgi phosphoprotein 3 (GPP34)